MGDREKRERRKREGEREVIIVLQEVGKREGVSEMKRRKVRGKERERER